MMMPGGEEIQREWRPGSDEKLGLRPLPAPEPARGGDVGLAQIGGYRQGKAADCRMLVDRHAEALGALDRHPELDVLADDLLQAKPVGGVAAGQKDKKDRGENGN